jgi:cell division protein FtsQ
VGDHILYLGRLPEGLQRSQIETAVTEFMDKKLTRIQKFYRYGLSQTGWNKYSYIDVEFDNQIICKKRQLE